MRKSLVVLAVAAALGCSGFLQQGPGVLYYRATTTLTALYALIMMPQETVDGFIKSFELFAKEKYSSEEDAEQILNYYTVINHLCALGEVEKMYIPPVMDQKLGIFANQVLWEEKGMADKLNIGPGKSVLDLGCGRGRIAHHVASHTGAKVTGLNLDPGQIKMADEYAQATDMKDNLTFVRGNYNHPLPFKDESFDAMYHVQALSYVQDLPALVKELHRVVKPGAKISFLDWFKLKAYNQEDPHHRHLLKEVKAVIGAVYTPDPEEYHTALKEAGFEILFSGEASADGGHQYPLVLQAQFFYETLMTVVDFLTKWGVLPKKFKMMLDRLCEGGESFVEADKLGLFTTSWQIIAQKPLKKRTA
mmetsp:Transcript_28974/g.73530  ORF Transcript_28974/g.73530 Transcript_28974/m.73530 type:complete len:362 (+) Transcript_28974:98-1183(+)|eukprot:CAMPEP_0183433654 /NCGR_PEP_ID=MMETSP0370-20130417/61530_1 /TAXON_ID=268820 /ORGANISM="Peridinium aciculiferum, Strain PAER-2" /LENGTH=361 /DNA_ID=CAMNT_0025620047 /DNA_START=76 /DNA_END=1161 /DNA_ORIENTATION=+